MRVGAVSRHPLARCPVRRWTARADLQMLRKQQCTHGVMLMNRFQLNGEAAIAVVCDTAELSIQTLTSSLWISTRTPIASSAAASAHRTADISGRLACQPSRADPCIAAAVRAGAARRFQSTRGGAPADRRPQDPDARGPWRAWFRSGSHRSSR
eukprot:1924017-Prymnesium_polylepis.1